MAPSIKGAIVPDVAPSTLLFRTPFQGAKEVEEGAGNVLDRAGSASYTFAALGKPHFTTGYLQSEERTMHMSFTRTIESPCRKCRNIHLNKEECSEECVDLKAFQEAIVHFDEKNISEFKSSKDENPESH